MTNYLLMFDNQKIILYANKKNTPSRDGYMITQIKRWLKSEILQGALSENPLTMEYESI